MIIMVILTSKLKGMLAGVSRNRCDTTCPGNLETLNLQRKDVDCCSWISLYLMTQKFYHIHKNNSHISNLHDTLFVNTRFGYLSLNQQKESILVGPGVRYAHRGIIVASKALK